MPSKLKKAIAAVKDQTSISLAKVSSTNAANLEVAILKATTHDENPIDGRYVQEVLQLIASNKLYAAACAQAIGRRIGKTRNWIVALKCLMLVLRIFQDGDPFFPREVLHAMKRGAKILNLSTFRDDSNSSPWDYTGFIRSYALYLDDRLDCFLTGKLQKRYTSRKIKDSQRHPRGGPAADPAVVCDMKPAMLLDRIAYWQRLLDRAIATRPTGAAMTNRLVRLALHAVVQESFDLYRDISDGLALLLDAFFHLPYQSCLTVFQYSVRASKQFQELEDFYHVCKSLGVGRTSEYPSVQRISDELVETLQEFLKDQASFPASLHRPAPPSSKASCSSSEPFESYEASEASEAPEKFSDRGSDYGSACTNLEDLMSGTDFGSSSLVFPEPDLFPGKAGKHARHASSSTNLPPAAGLQPSYSAPDFFCFEEWSQPEKDENKEEEDTQNPQQRAESATECWEFVLAETAENPGQDQAITVEPPTTSIDILFNQASTPHNYNPFLDDETESTAIVRAAPDPAAGTNDQTLFFVEDTFSIAPTFQASPTPTFCARSPNNTPMGLQDDPFAADAQQDDPFAPYATTVTDGLKPHGSAVDERNLLREQELWLQNQNRIIAKHLS